MHRRADYLEQGEDENVPVLHSRELVSVVDQWSNGTSSLMSDPGRPRLRPVLMRVPHSYSEVLGAGHWFDDVFDAPIVNHFLEDLLSRAARPVNLSHPSDFTLTTANPDESSSKLGFRILELETPGRLARIEVKLYDLPETSEKLGSIVKLRTINVRSFSFDGAVFEEALGLAPRGLAINSHSVIPLPSSRSTTFLSTKGSSSFSIRTPAPRRYGPLLSILTSPQPLLIVVGTAGSPSTTRHLASIAERIAHDSYLYGRVDCEIVRDEVVEEKREGNVVLLGDAFTNSVTAKWSKSWPAPGQSVQQIIESRSRPNLFAPSLLRLTFSFRDQRPTLRNCRSR